MENEVQPFAMKLVGVVVVLLLIGTLLVPVIGGVSGETVTKTETLSNGEPNYTVGELTEVGEGENIVIATDRNTNLVWDEYGRYVVYLHCDAIVNDETALNTTPQSIYTCSLDNSTSLRTDLEGYLALGNTYDVVDENTIELHLNADTGVRISTNFYKNYFVTGTSQSNTYGCSDESDPSYEYSYISALTLKSSDVYIQPKPGAVLGSYTLKENPYNYSTPLSIPYNGYAYVNESIMRYATEPRICTLTEDTTIWWAENTYTVMSAGNYVLGGISTYEDVIFGVVTYGILGGVPLDVLGTTDLYTCFVPYGTELVTSDHDIDYSALGNDTVQFTDDGKYYLYSAQMENVTEPTLTKVKAMEKTIPIIELTTGDVLIVGTYSNGWLCIEVGMDNLGCYIRNFDWTQFEYTDTVKVWEETDDGTIGYYCDKEDGLRGHTIATRTKAVGSTTYYYAIAPLSYEETVTEKKYDVATLSVLSIAPIMVLAGLCLGTIAWFIRNRED